MRYIRTEFGKIFDLDTMEFDWALPRENFVKANAIKQADTIEELCDEAVFFDKDNKPHYQSQEGAIWYLGASMYTETLRFGIFTDKGLIYVAKMNDKEELELL